MITDLLYGPNGLFEVLPPPGWWTRNPDLKAPFPWFGGKSKAAHLVWDRFGAVKNYVEPFLGSAAVLLARPDEPVIETANDFDPFVVNFWRAIQANPERVAEHCDWPVMELDLHSRHKYLVKLKPYIKARLEAEPTWFHPMIAGWWVWGLCAWIGSGWCTGNGLSTRLPEIGNGGNFGDKHGKGVHGKGARGLSQQLPDIDGKETRSKLVAIMQALANRLRYVRFTCGDFERILSPAVTWKHGLTGVFLDPPYPSDAGSTGGIYSSEAHERETFDRVFRWCVENGANKDLRIALCYYDGTTVRQDKLIFDVSHELRSLGWSIVEWKADGGYGGQSGKNENRHRERIAFSPHCQAKRQGTLF